MQPKKRDNATERQVTKGPTNRTPDQDSKERNHWNVLHDLRNKPLSANERDPRQQDRQRDEEQLTSHESMRSLVPRIFHQSPLADGNGQPLGISPNLPTAPQFVSNFAPVMVLVAESAEPPHLRFPASLAEPLKASVELLAAPMNSLCTGSWR